MKGQAATEYIVITAVILATLIPIFYYTYEQVGRTTRINQASDAVNTLARKAESVYALGPGSRDYIWIAVPSGIASTLVANGSVRLSFSDLGDAVAFTKVNLTGTIPTDPGIYRMAVEMLDNVVVIGPVNDTTIPIVIDTAPDGIVTVSNPVISATTNEAASCRYSTLDTAYASMANNMNGTGLGHTSQLSGLGNGDYIYYIRCQDSFSNVMTSSAVVNFTVILDASIPVINATAVNDTYVGVNQLVCISTTVMDSGTIDNVWAMLTNPLDFPLLNIANYTMTDTAPCAGGSGDNVYGIVLEMEIPGEWYINTSFANDTANNLGYQSPYPNILVNVSPESGEPAGVFEYLPVDVGLFYTNTAGSATAPDTNISLTSNTRYLTDEDLQTPSSSSRFRYQSSTNKYEGFIVQLNVSKGAYSAYSLRFKISDLTVNPYRVTIYAYQNNTHLTLANATNFSMTHDVIPGYDRGYNEITVTNVVMAGNSQYVKLRIIPETSMNGQFAYPKEADIGVTR